ncbi:hypothetical protein GPK41_07455 [Bifidobacterium adolescentis]|uniref:hypothetical protein n=1 Tax=Bifidobacterium adolescentis TaxID=1680 RepID=UPI001C036E74|nr:hypothetical protein [Bifidobacterium adolescentis]MBT9838897.1 hypothetical protein [Bifidobacterium adolescentis]
MEDNVTSDAVKDHPAGTGRNGKRVIVGVAAAVAVVLAVGGVCGYRAWEDHRVSVARGACGSAVAAQKKAVDSYRTLLGADATTAALKTDVKAVKDGKTLDALKRAVGAETPAMVKCDASDKTGLDEATAKADKTARSVKADAKTLQAAVRAVESSKLDKTVDDADGLYRATEGKVQDDKTRDALKQAIAKRDADAIAKAVRAVNDSKTAKDQADAEAAAKAQAEQEAAAQAAAAQAAAAQAAAAQQAQQQTQRSYSSGGWSGSAGGRSYSGGSYSGGSQGQGGGSPSGNSPAPSIHYDWEDKVTINPNCDGQHFCPLG